MAKITRSISPAALMGFILGGCLLGLVMVAIAVCVEIAAAFGIVWAHNQLAVAKWPYDFQHVGAIFVIIFIFSVLINSARRK